MATFERAHLEVLAYHYLNGDWEDAFGDFDQAMKDLTEELEAAVTDRWVEWKERTNVGFTTPPAGGSRSDSPLRSVVQVPVARDGR